MHEWLVDVAGQAKGTGWVTMQDAGRDAACAADTVAEQSCPEPAGAAAVQAHAEYAVAARAMCEFTARSGDLDLRFTPSPSAQEGILGHRLVAARRGAQYQTEVALSGDYKGLRVRGRADGYDAALNQLEEVKTYRGDLAAMRANHRALHWAQARVYGWLLCSRLGLAELRVALVYLDVVTQEETVLHEQHTAASLRAFFEEQCERFLGWARREVAHRAGRDAWLGRVAFPHPAFRPGQRELAESVYRSAASGRPCACSNWWRAKRPASTPTRPATAVPVRWQRGFTTACHRQGPPRPMQAGSTAWPCARWRWTTASARTT